MSACSARATDGNEQASRIFAHHVAPQTTAPICSTVMSHFDTVTIVGIRTNADYLWWLAGDTSVAVAMSLKAFVIPLIAFAVTGSTVQAGLVGSVTAVILLVTSAFGGVAVDRHDRRILIRVYAASSMAIWGSVLALTSGGQITFGWLIGLTSLWAALSGLFGHATDAALRSIVSQEDYPQAMAANEGRDAVVELTAAPLGALLYGMRGWLPFGVVLLGYMLLGVSTWLIRTDLRPPPYVHRSIIGDIASGCTWMWRRHRLRILMGLAMLFNFGLSGILYTFILSMVGSGAPPLRIGFLATAGAVATILGSLLAGRVVQRTATGRIVRLTTTWTTVSFVPAVIWDGYWVMVSSLACASVFIPAMLSSVLGFIFGQTPIELQGRVQSMAMLITSGLGALAPLAAGLLLQNHGYHWAIATFLSCLIAPASIAALSRSVHEIPVPSEWASCPL